MSGVKNIFKQPGKSLRPGDTSQGQSEYKDVTNTTKERTITGNFALGQVPAPEGEAIPQRSRLMGIAKTTGITVLVGGLALIGGIKGYQFLKQGKIIAPVQYVTDKASSLTSNIFEENDRRIAGLETVKMRTAKDGEGPWAFWEDDSQGLGWGEYQRQFKRMNGTLFLIAGERYALPPRK